MPQWISVADGFIEADVIRWRDPIWEQRGRSRRGRVMKIGDRLVTAQIIWGPDKDGWLDVEIISCEIIKLKDGKKPEMWTLKKDKIETRKLSTLKRGKAERKLWTDESARAVIASRFIGNEKKPKRLRKDEFAEE